MVGFWDVDWVVCSAFTLARPFKEDLASHHLATLLNRLEKTIDCGGVAVEHQPVSRELVTKGQTKKETNPLKLDEHVYKIYRPDSRLSAKQEAREDEDEEAETPCSTVDQEVRQVALCIDADNVVNVDEVKEENRRHIQEENGFETVWMNLEHVEPVEKQMSRVRSFSRLLWPKAGKDTKKEESRSTEANLAKSDSEESPLTLCHIVDKVLDDDSATEIENGKVAAIFQKEMEEWFVQNRNKCDVGFDLSALSVRGICRDAISRSSKGARTSLTPLLINDLHMKTAKIRSFAKGKMQKLKKSFLKTTSNTNTSDEEHEEILSIMDKAICDENMDGKNIDDIFDDIWTESVKNDVCHVDNEPGHVRSMSRLGNPAEQNSGTGPSSDPSLNQIVLYFDRGDNAYGEINEGEDGMAQSEMGSLASKTVFRVVENTQAQTESETSSAKKSSGLFGRILPRRSRLPGHQHNQQTEECNIMSTGPDVHHKSFTIATPTISCEQGDTFTTTIEFTNLREEGVSLSDKRIGSHPLQTQCSTRTPNMLMTRTVSTNTFGHRQVENNIKILLP